VASIFQSILFHRSYGKFTYKHEGSYSIGTLGYEETVCDFIDFTYIRCASPTLVDKVNTNIREFVERLRENQNQQGVVSLEFYLRRKGRWNLLETPLTWEVWTINVDCKNRTSSERLEDAILEKITAIIQALNAAKCFVPPMPTEQNIDTVFDTTYPDVQPYLHKINYRLGPGHIGGVASGSNQDIPSSAFKKLIKEAFF